MTTEEILEAFERFLKSTENHWKSMGYFTHLGRNQEEARAVIQKAREENQQQQGESAQGDAP